MRQSTRLYREQTGMETLEWAIFALVVAVASSAVWKVLKPLVEGRIESIF
jgi:hypothetical protein